MSKISKYDLDKLKIIENKIRNIKLAELANNADNLAYEAYDKEIILSKAIFFNLDMNTLEQLSESAHNTQVAAKDAKDILLDFLQEYL